MKADGRTRRTAEERDKGYSAKVDVVVTSPPFADQISDRQGGPVDIKGHLGVSGRTAREYSADPKNIGNLKQGDIDAVVTSPPYEDSMDRGGGHGLRRRDEIVRGRGMGRGYGPKTKGNIARLKGGKIDQIITSPPYSEGEFDTKHGMNGSLSPNLRGRKVWENREKVPMKKGANIATLKHGKASSDGICTCEIDGVLDFPSTAGFGWYANLFGKDAVAHPAKANLMLLRYLIENFTKPGDTVLDPMSGTGSTCIMAADLGRNGIAVELEDRFYGWIKDNIKTAVGQGVKGDLKVVKGDARNLSALLPGVDGVITSPPYGDSTIQDYGSSNRALLAWERGIRKQFGKDGFIIHDGVRYTEKEWRAKNHGELKPRGFPELWAKIVGVKERQRYNDGNPDNIGNLEHGSVDAVVSSPPYGQSVSRKGKGGSDRHPEKRRNQHPRAWLPADKYSDDVANIGNLKQGSVDAVISSPPYADAKKGGKADVVALVKRWDDKYEFAGSPESWSWGRSWATKDRKRALESMGSGYSEDPANIGNLRAGDVDSVMMSPPYMNGEAFADPTFMRKITAEQSAKIREGRVKGHYRSPEAEKAYLGRMAEGRVQHPDSISKIEKQETYLEAMLKVYRESYAVLKPGGRMVLILKDFVRNKKIVLLHEHTMKLCEFVGFRRETHLKSKLPTQSFWRVLYLKKHANDVPGLDELNYEHILVFVKPKSA